MRMIDHYEHAASSQSVSNFCTKQSRRGFLGSIRKLAQSLASRARIRSMYRLDDDLLRDIGLVRGDIDWALSVPLYVDPSMRLNEARSERLRTQHCRIFKTDPSVN